MPQQGLAQLPQQEPNQLVAQFEKSLEQLNDRNKERITKMLTPEAVALFRLVDPVLAEHVKGMVDPTKTLRPIPIAVMRDGGEENLRKFIEKGLKNIQELPEPVAQVGGRPQGLGSPSQQVPQQAPVSPPAPTGLASRPQLPLPSSSNATAVDNQPIR